MGFEHCVANLYLLPVGMLSGANVILAGFLGNIVPVTLSNTVGGAGLAAAYWLVYLSDGSAAQARLHAWRIRTGEVVRSACAQKLQAAKAGGCSKPD